MSLSYGFDYCFGQEILRDTNENMPVFLEEKSMFSVLGRGAAYLSGNGKVCSNIGSGSRWIGLRAAKGLGPIGF